MVTSKYGSMAIRTAPPIGMRIAMLTIPLWLSSCGDARYDAVPTYPVSGHVAVDGKPVEGAYVKLTPVKDLEDPDALSPRGKTDAGGIFQLSTYEKGDGAPAGRYAVTIVWLEPANPPKKLDPGPDRLGGRYADPQDAHWRVEVDEENDVLKPFVIESVP